MRLLKFWECVGLLAVTIIVFAIANAIGSHTQADSQPVWARDCTARASVADNNATIKCGAYSETEVIDHKLAVAFGAAPRALKCRAFKTRGIDGDIILDCG